MIELALIPARGGSKRLPGKNLLSLGGVPLIGWTIAAARESGICRRVVVSTDDPAIAHAAKALGAEVPFLRPAELAEDHTASDDVIAHSLSELQVTGNFILLQPTSPFRTGAHIREAFALHKVSKAQLVLSVAAAKPLSWMLKLDAQGGLAAAIQEQASSGESCAIPNGAIYLTDNDTFASSNGLPKAGRMGLPMGTIDSLDIDTSEDFALAEAVVAAGLRPVCGE